MRPPAPCRCKSATGDRIGAAARRFKKEEQSKTRHHAAVRNIRYRRTEVRARGSTRSIARSLDLYEANRPPPPLPSSTLACSVTLCHFIHPECSGAKQIIRGKDASRFGRREKQRERERERESQIRYEIFSFIFFFSDFSIHLVLYYSRLRFMDILRQRNCAS